MSKQIALLGADPEFFLTDTSGSDVPAFGLIGGTKEAPKQIPDYRPGFMMQEDGAAVEFNIPPAETPKTFTMAIGDSMAYFGAWARSNGYMIKQSTELTLRSKYLKDERSTVLGCSPDFNAYADPANNKRTPPQVAELGTKRYAGAHLHLQYNLSAMPAFVGARYCDIFAGLPAVRYDMQGGRRRFYGGPGIHRPKPYGLEYRTLGNFWLFLPRASLTVLASNVIAFGNSTYNTDALALYQEAYGEIPWGDVQAAITSENADLANSLIEFLRGKYGFQIQTY